VGAYIGKNGIFCPKKYLNTLRNRDLDQRLSAILAQPIAKTVGNANLRIGPQARCDFKTAYTLTRHPTIYSALNNKNFTDSMPLQLYEASTEKIVLLPERQTFFSEGQRPGIRICMTKPTPGKGQSSISILRMHEYRSNQIDRFIIHTTHLVAIQVLPFPRISALPTVIS